MILIPGSIVGVVLGVSLLVHLKQATLLVILGVFIILFALRSLLNLHVEKRVSQVCGLPARMMLRVQLL